MAVLLKELSQFCLCLPHRKQMHVTPIPFELLKRNKDFQTTHGQESKIAYSFCCFEASFIDY